MAEDKPTSSGVWLAIGLAIAGIVAGGITSYIFFKMGEKAGKISMYVDQVQVIDKDKIGQTSIKVLDQEGKSISTNVYAANIVIWNSGNAEIKPEDVREKFNIGIANVSFVELTPTFYTKNNLDKFALSKSGVLEWEHFDPGQGVKVRAIYGSVAQQQISLTGYAVNSDDIDDYQIDAKRFRDFQNNELFKVLEIFPYIGIPLFIVTIYLFYIRGRTTLRQIFSSIRKPQGLYPILMAFYVIVVIAMSHWTPDIAANLRPPF